MKWYKDKKYLVGSFVFPIVLVVVGWIYANSSNSDSITNAPNNTGIITQGQTGNNIVNVTPPPQPPAPCRDLVDATHTFFSPGSEPKTTIFTPFPKDELKKRVQTTATELRNFASDYRKKITDRLKAPQSKEFTLQKAELDDLEKQSTFEFQTKILPQARELHFELLRRLNLQWPVCSTSGLSIEGYRAIALGLIGAEDAGPTNVAKYLETLANSLS